MRLPILYSYRRCPYAMRARMALKMCGIEVEFREISLRDKPKHMLAISPKGTVPVLLTLDNLVIDESLDIMHWALAQTDQHDWLQADQTLTQTLITENDGSFKKALDAYKYHDRFPEKTQEAHREDGERFLEKLENLLHNNPYLLSEEITMADIAIMPFIRQFAGVDRPWFEASQYVKLNAWLEGLLNGELFKSIMQKRPTYTE